ncbi:MAG: OmpH family outer membrane protein [Rikenellaceae bacterium]|jgi:outer membrane protein|nr:OmpH family outer membrane protein [Rikenellaceae bacterium]
MKKIFALLLGIVAFMGVASAQNYMVVDSEKIFKSINEYNNTLVFLDNLAKSYQQQVDAKYQQIENLYNNYQQQKANLSAATRTIRENEILEKEAEAVKFQESIFGNEGEMMKKRIELIQPIQERVFKAIESYAKANGFDLVLDIASNATMLYYSPAVDRTEAVIQLVK